mmetsp:Transcript_26228/g.68895  ORF Transcript_26228/g.68895 Transcript_26228/m.68895 type:complete len:329 (-) Transcript_26228:6-992(-)
MVPVKDIFRPALPLRRYHAFGLVEHEPRPLPRTGAAALHPCRRPLLNLRHLLLPKAGVLHLAPVLRPSVLVRVGEAFTQRARLAALFFARVDRVGARVEVAGGFAHGGQVRPLLVHLAVQVPSPNLGRSCRRALLRWWLVEVQHLPMVVVGTSSRAAVVGVPAVAAVSIRCAVLHRHRRVHQFGSVREKVRRTAAVHRAGRPCSQTAPPRRPVSGFSTRPDVGGCHRGARCWHSYRQAVSDSVVAGRPHPRAHVSVSAPFWLGRALWVAIGTCANVGTGHFGDPKRRELINQTMSCYWTCCRRPADHTILKPPPSSVTVSPCFPRLAL